MAITILNGLFLLEAKAAGASFDATLTLGRATGFLAPRDARRMAKALAAIDPSAPKIMVGGIPEFMDEFLVALGAKRLEAIDASDFEGAQIIHDMNEPLPEILHGQYDAVIDGGTLEHVFNVPIAFRNAMDAVKVGGHFFAFLPANNWCGHGFYQYSAEFFYRVFSAENGFKVIRLMVAPVFGGGRWLDGPAFEVADPTMIGDRVHISGRGELSFLLQARKIESRAAFSRWPQQSDYSATWTAAARGLSPAPAKIRRKPWLFRRLGAVMRMGIRGYGRWMWRRRSLAHPALKQHDWTF
jgi:SAM-dependent methyltransferase